MLKKQGGALCLISLFLCSCIPEGDLKLPIPYRAQERYNYCVPAAVLMWRLYDGLSPVTQSEIFNWFGGHAPNQLQTANMVNAITNTHDAYWDAGSSRNYKEMVSRQVTSFDRQVPSLAVIYYDHVVVVTGGKYHVEGGLRIWDSIRVHDPDPWVGAHAKWSAGEWLNQFCGVGQPACDQIVSQLGVDGWYQNMTLYAGSVKIYGWDRDLGGPIVY